MSKSDFGIIGLGVMGTSIGTNVLEKGFALSAYNRTENDENQVVKKFLETHKSFKNISGFTDLSEFVNSLAQPRKILLMIKAGDAVDQMLEKITPFLAENDVIIDGGNSYYLDTKKRFDLLATKNIGFIGCGISGGEEGARKGPSMMPGGNISDYNSIASVLEAISAKDIQNNPCCAYIGPEGAGHFVKMVHNGIEYAEMQLLAELYALMATTMDYSEISDTFSNWNNGNLSSYLLEITIEIFQKKEGENYLLDLILDKAANKGTGAWSSKTALDLGYPNTMMSSAVFARYISSFKEKRAVLSKVSDKRINQQVRLDLGQLKSAYHFARIINHHQGFELIRLASEEFQWNINLSEIARIWTNGCIIRSNFMLNAVQILKNNESIFEDDQILNSLNSEEYSIVDIIKFGLSNRIALDTFWSAYNYWISMTTHKLPANLIQAQRDYFGAHGYQRNDRDSGEFFHTIWNKE